jgi:hypothetical protein
LMASGDRDIEKAGSGGIISRRHLAVLGERVKGENGLTDHNILSVTSRSIY